MPKCSLKRIAQGVGQLRVAACMLYVTTLLIVVVFFTYYGQYDYPHIPEEKIQETLYRATVPNLVKKSKIDCKYDDILSSTESLEPWQVPTRYDDFSPAGIANGSYAPEHCNPAFSVAILVTYRNRQKHLDIFLPYMHNFLRKQNIHYKIYVIEQRDDAPWNKGLLYNVGARRAVADGWPCLLLHDVDLLPLAGAALAACSAQPRHLSASIDKFRYVLPYSWLAGGVVAVRADQFVRAGGFSDRFLGWGGEDDDFYHRLRSVGLTLQRFPRRMSRYTMLRHAPAPRNPARRRLLRLRAPGGVAAPRYSALALTHHRLFTLLAVTT